ncbi:hypothetical protein EVA_07139 [gut metagenome]|uniref:Uncharacterized protein n=1 Tax=gut metagenome TaxID=749906 RepID=J9GBQ5_9ZZZZ
MTTFHVHHHCNRHTTCDPLFSRSCCILNDSHVTSLAISNELSCTCTESIAVVRIVVRRSCATTFITEEVVLSCKLTYELTFSLPSVQLLGNHFRKQLFSFDQRNLYVTVRVTFHSELLSYTFWEAFVDACISSRKLAQNPCSLFFSCNITSFWSSEQVVQFCDELLHCRDELDQTFRNQYCTEVVTSSSTLSYNTCDISNDIVESHVLFFYFFANDTYVRLALECAFQSDVTS